VCKYVKGNGTEWVPGRKHAKSGIWPHLQWLCRQNKKIKEMTYEKQNFEIFIPKGKIIF